MLSFITRLLCVNGCIANADNPLGLDFEDAGISVVHPIICFEGIELLSAYGEHDMGTFLWLNAETLERVPTPHFGKLVR